MAYKFSYGDAFLSGTTTFLDSVTLGDACADEVTSAGRLTASCGVFVLDDQKLVFGTGTDATFEYDEDGTDRLLYTGAGIRIDDDTKLEFGIGGDATIEYDEDGTDELRFAGAAVTFEQAVTFDGAVTLGDAVADTTTVTGHLTCSAGISVLDDMKLSFGTGNDSTIEYDEGGSDQLRWIVPAAGLVVTGGVAFGATAAQPVSLVGQVTASAGVLCNTTLDVIGTTTLAGALAADGTVTLGNAVADTITSTGHLTCSAGISVLDDMKLSFGTNNDSTIEYDENGNDKLRWNLPAGGLEITGTLATNLVPQVDSTHDLGSNSNRWANIYVDSITGASVAMTAQGVFGPAAETIDSGTDFCFVSGAGGANLKLPPAVAGKRIFIKQGNACSNTTIIANTSDLIPEITGSLILASTGSGVTMIALDATNWYIQ